MDCSSSSGHNSWKTVWSFVDIHETLLDRVRREHWIGSCEWLLYYSLEFTLLGCLNVEKSPFTWVRLEVKSEAPLARVYHSASLCVNGSANGMIVAFGGRSNDQQALFDTWGLRRHRDGKMGVGGGYMIFRKVGLGACSLQERQGHTSRQIPAYESFHLQHAIHHRRQDEHRWRAVDYRRLRHRELRMVQVQ